MTKTAEIMPPALWQLSAVELADGYRSGAFTPVDALDACLARVAQCQPTLNAMVLVDSTGAHLAAEASTQRWASGKPLGPLDGIPVSLKDNLHAAGWPTSWGSQLLKGFVAQQDELPVARLRAAGAVLFGKTNLPEFAMSGFTTNTVWGSTRNPWNPALSPGGSSGGAVAAVAAGCGPMALATDGGGSIRRPASHCGLVGFKPSAGLVERSGGLPELFLSHEVVGGITRSVADARSLSAVLAGKALDAPAKSGAADKVRILFVPRFGTHPVDDGIAVQAKLAASHFAALGCQVEEAAVFTLADRINALWPSLSATALAWMMGDSQRCPEFGLPAGTAPDTSVCGEGSQATLRAGQTATAADMFELLTAVQEIKRKLDALFTRHDFILTPATAAMPWPVEETHPSSIAGQPVGPRGHAVFTGFVNAAGLPAIALPCGSVGGLPTGFQLVGPKGSDAALLAIAQQYEAAYPWAGLWPDIA